MRQLILTAAVAAGLAMSMGGAQAMPIAPADSLGATADVTLVSGGCGRFMHRGPLGGCRTFGHRIYRRPFRPHRIYRRY